MNTPCNQVREHLDGYLSRELPDETRREVERHLANCPQCAAEFETGARLRAQLQAAVRATPVPVHLDAKVRRAVRGEYRAAAHRTVGRRRGGPDNHLRSPCRPAACLEQPGRSHPAQDVRAPGGGAECGAAGSSALRRVSQIFQAARAFPRDGRRTRPRFADLVPLVQAKLPRDFRIIQGHHCDAGGHQFTHLIVAGGAGGGKIVSAAPDSPAIR